MASMIEDEFYLYKNKYFPYNVKLTLDYLSYTPCTSTDQSTNTAKELVKDIIGCALMKLKNVEKSHEVFITIYSYPLIAKKRKCKAITFKASSKNTFEENFNIANRWRSLIYYAMYNCKEDEQSLLHIYKYQKKVLVLINPKSGPGIALQVYKNTLKAILSQAEVDHDLVITDHAFHAYELVQQKDLSIYSGIVIVAGDGLIYEVYNGLLQRRDCDSAVTIPIGVIPGGSGNGLASSISHWTNEPYLSNPVLVSSLNVANPVISPMDLVLLQTPKGNKLLSFLSIGFGILSDIDIESEKMRAIGEARFTLYGLTRIFNLRKYKAKLSYKVACNVVEQAAPPPPRPFLVRSQTVEDNCEKLPLPQRSNSFSFAPDDESIATLDSGPSENSEEMSRIKVESPDPSEKTEQDAWRLHSNSVHKEFEANFSEPVPQDWETIEDEFISIYAVNQPYINSKSIFSPKSTLNDGIMWLCFMRGNVQKSSVLKFLISIESGTHIDIPGVSYVPVTDLRLVSLSSCAKITVDGELLQVDAIQATMLPSKGRVMVRRP